MASFRSCITDALQKGDIDAEAAQTATEAYDDAFAVASETFGPVEADRVAAERTMAKLEAEAIEARRRRQLSVRTRRAMMEDLATFKSRRGHEGVHALGGGDGSGRPPKGGWVQGGTPPPQGPGSKGALAAYFLERKIENLPGQSGVPGASAAGQHRELVGRAHAMMADLIERFESRSGLKVRSHRAEYDNLTREAFGEDTGDLASKGMAEAWRETAEWLRQRFNAAGGAIGKLEDWGLPQTWNAARVRDVGRDAWVAAVAPRLNRAKMVDRMTGLPFTDSRLTAVLGEVWQTIATGGASKVKPGERVGQGMLAKRRAEARFLIFNNADDWMAVQGQFGEGDPFQAMMGHIDDMALDIAQMEVFGPNPEAQIEWMKAFALREAALEEANGAEGAIKKAERSVMQADRMYEHLTGQANVAMRPTVATLGANTRAAMNGILLGSAVLGEVASGPYFGRMARSFSGLSRNGDMGELVRLLALPSERAIARRSGFIIEQATDGFVRASQDNLRLLSAGDRATGGLNAFARRMPAATMRTSFLTPIVSARKRSFRFEFMGRLHDLKDRSLADLRAGDADDKMMAEWFDARGFTEADWTVMRSAPTWEPRKGAAFLRPADVPIEALGNRLGEAIEMETRFMTPETTLWTRAKLAGVERPGTVSGEVRRSWAMMRGFTLTASNLYSTEFAVRGFQKTGSVQGMLGYSALMAAYGLAFLTVGGALNIQLREIVKGNDPRPMTDMKFWGASMLQGGGLGIFGDFLYASEARNGKSSGIVAAGPVGQVISDAKGLTWDNGAKFLEELEDGETVEDAIAATDPGRDVATVARNYNPLASLWWTRAAYSRLVADQLQLMLDPEAEAAFARRQRRMERDMGQTSWWPQGELAPARAPDLANAGRPVEPR